MTRDELKAIEAIVNEQIRANSDVTTRLMSMDAAMEAGAMALFGEKYGDEVRVLAMGGDFSVELCGGTHVARTDRAESQLAAIADLVKGDTGNVVDKVGALRAANRELEKEVERLKQKLAASAGGDLAAQAVEVNGARVLAASLDGADPKSLRDTVDQLKNKLGSGVILLAAVNDDRIALTAGVTADLTDQVKAGDLMKEFAGRLGGKGGGRPDMAQGGGSDVAALAATLRDVPGWVEARLSEPAA